MTCKGFEWALWCCSCVKNFCITCSRCLFSLSLIALTCITLGMAIMLTLVIVYYVVVFPSTPTASLEHTGMYDYINEYSVLKRDVSRQLEEMEDDYYPWEERDDGNPRNKRNSTLTSKASTMKTTAHKKPTTSPKPTHTTAKTKPTAAHKAHKEHSKAHHTVKISSTTRTPNAIRIGDVDLDYHLANTFVDSVFAQAETANSKEHLGLCRKTADVHLPNVKATSLPSDQVPDLLSCVNDVLMAHSQKQFCIHLDPEMHAYLRWLIITGEPKAKHRQMMSPIVDDFLFPHTPCANKPLGSTDHPVFSEPPLQEAFSEPPDKGVCESQQMNWPIKS